jgi:hypothetical protein
MIKFLNLTKLEIVRTGQFTRNANKLETKRKHLSVTYNFQINSCDLNKTNSRIFVLRLFFARKYLRSVRACSHVASLPTNFLPHYCRIQNVMESTLHVHCSVVINCLILFQKIKFIDKYKQLFTSAISYSKTKSFATINSLHAYLSEATYSLSPTWIAPNLF